MCWARCNWRSGRRPGQYDHRGQTGILLLAGGVMGTVIAQDNTISADVRGIDFEQGKNDFTATGNDIAAEPVPASW